MSVWKKSKAKNYYITRNEIRYTVVPDKFNEGSFTLMIQRGNKNTSFISVDGDNMVDAVRSATLYIKSRIESITA